MVLDSALPCQRFHFIFSNVNSIDLCNSVYAVKACIMTGFIILNTWVS